MKDRKCSLCGREYDGTMAFIQGDTGNNVCLSCIEAIADMMNLSSRSDEEIRITKKEVIDGEELKSRLGNYFEEFADELEFTDVEEFGEGEDPLEPDPLFEKIKPSEMKEYLDQYVAGQDSAKKVLSVAVYNHIKRINRRNETAEIGKSNILLAGPTGCGKTYLIENMAEKAGLPFISFDCSQLTTAGYKGGDTSEIIEELYYKAGSKRSLAEKGIVLLDEIDKIRTERTSEPTIGTKKVQQELLKMIEGTVQKIRIDQGLGAPKTVRINTKNILFICAGAFIGLDRIVAKRIGKNEDRKNVIGFNRETVKKKKNKVTIENIETEDLIRYGIIPELAGRIQTYAVLKELRKEDLIDIMKNKRNTPIEHYKELLAEDGIELIIEDKELENIAEEAIKSRTGARGIRRIIEKKLLDYMYRLPDEEDVEKVIFNGNGVEIVKKKKIA